MKVSLKESEQMNLLQGAMTICIMAFGTMTLSVMTFRMATFFTNDTLHSDI